MSQDFSSQLPPTDFSPTAEMDPRLDEFKRYREHFFDPRYDGYTNELVFLCDVPYRASVDVKSSTLGAGFEVLDHRSAYDIDKVIPIMKNSGVKWGRLQSGWQRAEKEKGVYDFGWLDHIVDELLRIGIQPWISLSFGNGLYMNAVPIPPHDTYFFSPTVFGDECQQAWINYCKAMATHFKDRVRYWEVWNEPNAGFLRKPAFKDKIVWEEPDEYAKLVAITEKAIHEVQPDGYIIGGSISGCAICNEYIQKLFDAGIAEHINAFSYHPYQALPEVYYHQRLQFIRNLIKKSGRNIDIWQGENGRPSDSITLNCGWKSTEGSQARYLTRRYLTDLREQVKVASYFQSCDMGNGYLKNTVHSYGVIDARDPNNYYPKLAFRAMQSFAWMFDSNTQLVDDACFEVYPETPLNATTRYAREVASQLTCGFRYKNIPIFAYYQLSNVDADSIVIPVNIEAYIDLKEYKFDKPILIDPITARVYRIKKVFNFCDGNYGHNHFFTHLPILDYPLFVTDARLLDK